MGVHICFPFGFTQVYAIIYPYGHLHMFPTWVFPDFSLILPIWAFSYISHLGSPRFVPYGTHIGIHIYFPFVLSNLGFPRFVPYFTHMGILIYFPFGFPQVCPIWDPYWYSHLFPICVCPGFTHKIPIWAFTFVSHLGLLRFMP